MSRIWKISRKKFGFQNARVCSCSLDIKESSVRTELHFTLNSTFPAPDYDVIGEEDWSLLDSSQLQSDEDDEVQENPQSSALKRKRVGDDKNSSNKKFKIVPAEILRSVLKLGPLDNIGFSHEKVAESSQDSSGSENHHRNVDEIIVGKDLNSHQLALDILISGLEQMTEQTKEVGSE